VGIHVGMRHESAQVTASPRQSTSLVRADRQHPTTELRDVMIAVLGHDLRTPLAAIASGAQLLLSAPDLAHRSGVPSMIERSASRMRELVNTLLDLSRGGLMDRVRLSRWEATEIENALRVAIEEHRTAWPDRAISCEFGVRDALKCDLPRVVQLTCNLLSNALLHGESGPVAVRASNTGTQFQVSITNRGGPVLPEQLYRARQPPDHARDKNPGSLGLGLYIAGEIALAHRGTVEVTCEHGLVCFTFRMPVSVA
jgi:signal transduction histidine kinase